MKLKHYAGYGTVDVKKISLKKLPNNTKELVVAVTGNHECGLKPCCDDTLFDWIVKRFDKTSRDYRDIISYTYDSKYVSVNGKSTEQYVYTFILENR